MAFAGAPKKGGFRYSVTCAVLNIDVAWLSAGAAKGYVVGAGAVTGGGGVGMGAWVAEPKGTRGAGANAEGNRGAGAGAGW